LQVNNLDIIQNDFNSNNIQNITNVELQDLQKD
jgi:hypothetical protein